MKSKSWPLQSEIRFVFEHFTESEKEKLNTLGPLYMRKRVTALARFGEELINNLILPTNRFYELINELEQKHPYASYNNLETLAYFTLGYQQEQNGINIKKINDNSTGMSRRTFLITIPAVAMNLDNSTGDVNQGIDEEKVEKILRIAQQSRLACRFNEVKEITKAIEKYLNNFSSVTASFWRGKTYDLQVENLFTQCNPQTFNYALNKSKQVCELWDSEVEDPVANIHSYLRLAVIYRQIFEFQENSDYLDEAATALHFAEDLLTKVSKADLEQTSFFVYRDLAKTYNLYSDATETQRYCDKAQEAAQNSSQSLSKLSAETTMLSVLSAEVKISKNKKLFLFGRGVYNNLEQAYDHLTRELTKKEIYEDIILSVMMKKALIMPLLHLGQKDEGIHLFSECKKIASKHNLLHQLQRFKSLQRKYPVLQV